MLINQSELPVGKNFRWHILVVMQVNALLITRFIYIYNCFQYSFQKKNEVQIFIKLSNCPVNILLTFSASCLSWHKKKNAHLIFFFYSSWFHCADLIVLDCFDSDIILQSTPTDNPSAQSNLYILAGHESSYWRCARNWWPALFPSDGE